LPFENNVNSARTFVKLLLSSLASNPTAKFCRSA
jgi:hypothetical protein